MLDGIEGVEEYTLKPKRLNGHQIVSPVKVKGFVDYAWRPGFHLQYEFRSLGQSVGVVGSDYFDAEQQMYETLIGLYSDMIRIGYDGSADTRDADQKLVDSLGLADLSAFIMPVCLPAPQPQ